MSKYKNVARYPVDLDGGQTVEPGEFVSLKEVGPRAQQLIDDGQLLIVGEEKDKGAGKASGKAGE